MKRDIRYQAAIVERGRILLIRYAPRRGASYWLLPGGGREDETEEECVVREVREETHLEVRVERIILEVPATPSGIYERWRTYLCSVVAGDARPGVEPEPEVAPLGDIVEVRWFELADESDWGDGLRSDAITYPQLVEIRAQLARQASQ